MKLDSEFKNNCKVWLAFLDQQPGQVSVVNRPMIDISKTRTAQTISFYSDASGSENLVENGFLVGGRKALLRIIHQV